MATDVNGIIEKAQESAKEMADQAADMITKAQLSFNTHYEIGVGEIEMGIDNLGNLNVTAPPKFSGQQFQPPPAPGAPPVMLPIPDVDAGEMPNNKAVRPTPNPPQRPAQLSQFTRNAPSMNSLVVPSAPDALMNLNITPPKLTDILVPGAPIVQLPAFDAIRPLTNLPEPGDIVAQYRQDFGDQSNRLVRTIEGEVDVYMAKINPRFKEQMAAIEDRLAAYIKGGSALSASVQNDIFEKALDKTNIEYQRARDGAYEEGARRGFTMPGGAVFSAVTQARQGAADNAARVAMEIAVKQAELEQQNLQFAVTQSTNLRQVVIQAAQEWAGQLVQINAQALQFAQGVLQASIDLYDLRIKIVQARVQIYQAEAEVYQHRLKAVLAVYDAYQAHIEGLKAQVSVDTARVQAFTAQASAYGTLANAYKAVIEGVATKAQIEKLKVEAFGAEVQAYQAATQAKAAEWNGYRAQLEGESAKVEAYRAELQAYGQEVQAYQAKVQAKSAEAQAVGLSNESKAKGYLAVVSGYSALVQGKSAESVASIQSYDSELKGWEAKFKAEEARAKVAAANAVAIGTVNVAAYKAQADVVISNAQMNYKKMSDLSQVGVAGARVFGTMAGSALSGMNSLAAAIETSSL